MKKRVVLVPPAMEELAAMPLGLRGALLILVDVLEEEGRLTQPQGKIVDRDHRIFEIRAKDDEVQGRLLYHYLDDSDEVYGLVAFVKKTEKTPKQVIELAKKRLKLVLKGAWGESHGN
jgi:phage-related protein